MSAYGIFFDPTTITNNLALMNGAVPAEVLNEVNQQAERIATNGRAALSAGVMIGIWTLWSAISGVKATWMRSMWSTNMETRCFIGLNVVALLITLAGFAAFLLAMAGIVISPIVLSFFAVGGEAAAVTG